MAWWQRCPIGVGRRLGCKKLTARVAAQPDATLAELRQQLVAAGSPAVGQTVFWQTLQ